MSKSQSQSVNEKKKKNLMIVMASLHSTTINSSFDAYNRFTAHWVYNDSNNNLYQICRERGRGGRKVIFWQTYKLLNVYRHVFF